MFEELFTNPAYLIYGISIVLIVPCFIFGVIASARVNSVFNKYNKVNCTSGITAEGYVMKFLEANDVHGIHLSQVHGALTDNFDPRKKTIALSDSVRGACTVGAIGVACHEAGHAIQHAKKYFFSSARLVLVPIVNGVSGFMWPVFIIGFSLGFASPFSSLGVIFLIIGLVVMGLSLLFSLVTLPVEFDASRRAYNYLKGSLLPEEAKGVKKVLNAAAMTYVASFMMSFVQFLRIFGLLLIAIGSGRRRK